MNKAMKFIVIVVVLFVAGGIIIQKQINSKSGNIFAGVKEEALGIPRMIDLGSTMCISCKEMEPILEELITEYEGRLLIEFIDVTKNQERTRQYGVNVIPTQIFFDADGNEFFRHIGFFSKEEILQTFTDHGIDY